MSRETDWHVFDKTCEIIAMAVRGSATQQSVAPNYVADLFREVHKALADVAESMPSSKQTTGF
jgi:hypothetical protein